MVGGKGEGELRRWRSEVEVLKREGNAAEGVGRPRLLTCELI